MYKLVRILFVLIAMQFSSFAKAQPLGILDEVIARIGNVPLLRSEFEVELNQAQRQYANENGIECMLLEQLLVKKLMLHQAKEDTIQISEERVQAEIDRRIRYFAAQMGSEKRLEEYLGKTIVEYKREIAPKIREQMLINEMESIITGSVKVTPKEVRDFYQKIPKDSLPLIGSEYEVAQILIKPVASKEAKEFAYETIKELRERLLNGESFAFLAKLYSDDKESAKAGGMLGEFGRGEMVPEFERAAFRLKPDSISKIIETQFGYHIVKLIERKGERIIARHILIRPQLLTQEIEAAQQKADSILLALRRDSLTLCQAVSLFSTDYENSKNCGFLSDPSTGILRIAPEYMDKDMAMVITTIQAGQYSEVSKIVLEDGSIVFRIIFLKSEIKPHTASLDLDYQRIQLSALQDKKQKVLDEWVKKKLTYTDVFIKPRFTTCPDVQYWIKKQ